MLAKISQGDLLYHTVHGLCRVDGLLKQDRSGKEVVCYSLVPKTPSKMKVRFVIAAPDLEVSGFHRLVSVKEANEIMEYLKEGDIKATPSELEIEPTPSLSQKNQTWVLAKAILSFSRNDLEAKDQKKRQMLEHSAKGLVEELAFVFKTTLKETATKVRESLGRPSRINPLVLAALTDASED